VSLSNADAVREMPLLPAAGGTEHRDELRDRFIRSGPDSVDDRELLELLLSGSHSAAEAGALALILLDTFGTAARVLAARPDTLRAVPGLGEAGVCAVKTAEALGIRIARAGLPDSFHPQLDTYERVIGYCRALAAHRDVEELHLLFLNTRNALIRDELHQRGTVDHTPAYPRQICVRALELQATGLVLLHNHPSTDPTPSRADVEMTNRVRDALKTIDVALTDHIVVTPTDAFSFRQKGLL